MFEALEIPAEHKDLIHDVAYDHYGKRMATCSSDQSIKIWDLDADGKWMLTSHFKAHSGSVWKVTWAHPEFGPVFASCSFDRTCAVWEEIIIEVAGNVPKGARHWMRRTNLVDSRTSLTDIKFGPKSLGLQLVTVSADGIIRIYEAPDIMNLCQWSLLHEIQLKISCSCLTWSPVVSKNHPPMFAVGSDDTNIANGGKVFIFEYSENLRRWAKVETVSTITDAVHDIAFAPNLGRSFNILAVATAKDVRILNLNPINDNASLQSGISKLEVQTVSQFEDHNCTVWRVCWNVTGTILASSGEDGCVRMYKMNYINAWKPVAVLKGDGTHLQTEASRGSISSASGSATPISQTARYIQLGPISQPRGVPSH